MSDQLLAVIGTLGAALLGFTGIIFTNYQNNRHATNLQRQKYDQDEATRNKERKLQLLDELSLLYFNLNKGKFVYLGKVDENGLPTFPLAEIVNRMSVIVLLYFDNLQKTYFEYIEAHNKLQKVLRDVDIIISATDLPEDAATKAKEISERLKDERTPKGSYEWFICVQA